tara:strand:- start:347 stop:502 length:156 start_codon:yes stop_codon:yes gene_type:complete
MSIGCNSEGIGSQQMPEGIRVQSDGKAADQLLDGTIGTLFLEYLKWFRVIG